MVSKLPQVDLCGSSLRSVLSAVRPAPPVGSPVLSNYLRFTPELKLTGRFFQFAAAAAAGSRTPDEPDRLDVTPLKGLAEIAGRRPTRPPGSQAKRRHTEPGARGNLSGRQVRQGAIVSRRYRWDSSGRGAQSRAHTAQGASPRTLTGFGKKLARAGLGAKSGRNVTVMKTEKLRAVRRTPNVKLGNNETTFTLI